VTPRPWTLIPHDTFKGIYELAEGTGYDRNTIAQAVHGERNARLLQAAPELVEALKSVLASVPFASYRGDGELEECEQRVRSVLAKVRES
jgi:hypothetical protein